MDLGIFSNGQRHNPIAAVSYEEDLFEIVAADELGYREVWVSEHIGVHRIDTQPAPELFLCAAAQRTEQIRLGVAVRCLPLYHPVDVATQASACDHMLRGRYNFGFGPGTAGDLQMRQRGLSGEERHPRMLEALDLVIQCWTSTEPFDYSGQFFQGRDINVLSKPYQKPHPPLAMASTTPANIEMAGRRGYQFFTSQYESGGTIRRMADAYMAGATGSESGGTRNQIGVARNVFVSDSVASAKKELGETAGMDMLDIKTHFPWLFDHYLPAGGSIEDVTFDWLVDSGMFIVGDPDTVYARLRELHDETGGFGLLMVVLGKDWGTRENRVRSLKLLKKEVGPRLALLDPTAPALVR